MAVAPIRISYEQMEREDQEIQRYLMQLEELRKECERRADFVRAQECVNRMREINFRQAHRLEAISRLANADIKNVLVEEHGLELLNFNRLWDDKFAEYDARAEEALVSLKKAHLTDYASREALLRGQLENKRPRFSQQVVAMRDHLEKLIRLRKYVEADSLKRKLRELEEKELQSFDKALNQTFRYKSQTIKKVYVNEISALEQKIFLGRSELEKQRQSDLQKLLRRHANVFKELDDETRSHVTMTKKSLERQLSAMCNDPAKTGLDFSAISEEIRERLRKHIDPMTSTYPIRNY